MLGSLLDKALAVCYHSDSVSYFAVQVIIQPDQTCQHVTYQTSGHSPAPTHFALNVIPQSGIWEPYEDGYDFG